MERAPLASQFAGRWDGASAVGDSGRLDIAFCRAAHIRGTQPTKGRTHGTVDGGLLALLLVAPPPTANVITFFGPSLVQGRYLYFGSVWSAIPLGAVLRANAYAQGGSWTLGGALASLAVFFNANVHKRRLDAMPGTVAHIASELRVNRQCREVALVAKPDQMNGALFI